MPTINQLSSTDSITDGDQFLVYKQNSGDARKVASSTIYSYIASKTTDTGNNPTVVDQYESPALNGFNITIASVNNNIFLYLTPTSAFTTGTITLPVSSGCFNGQTVTIFSTQQITTITIATNGALDVLLPPAALVENSSITLRYNSNNLIWYRVA